MSDSFQQEFCGPGTHIVTRLYNRRDRRVKYIQPHGVIGAEDFNVGGTAEALFQQRSEDTGGRHQVVHEHRRGWFFQSRSRVAVQHAASAESFAGTTSL